MDDGYLISESKEYLQYCMKELHRLCTESGIILNTKKTQIVKLSHGFTWIKCRFYITKSGKIIRKICKTSATRERRKLRKLGKKYRAGKITKSDVNTSYQSWRGYAANYNSYHTIKNMDKVFKEETA